MSNPDRLAIVDFKVGGQPRTVLDLERIDSDRSYVKIRDTFRFTPPNKKKVEAQQGGRYGGTRQVGETHENATVSAQWLVRGNTADECLDRVAALLEEIDSTVPGRYLQWLPSGASPSRTVFFERRGTAAWTTEYKWVEYSGRRYIPFEISFPVAPLARLHPCDVEDLFDDSANLGEYTFDAGEELVEIGSILVSTVPFNILAPTGDLDVERRARHTARGYQWLEAQVTCGFRPGETLDGVKGGVILRAVSEDTYLEVYVDDTGTNSRLRLDKVVDGVRTNLQSTTVGTRISDGTSFWVRGRIEGHTVYREYYVGGSNNPNSPLETPVSAPTSWTLDSTDQETFGAGDCGWSWIPQHADALASDFSIRPFTRGPLTFPTTVAWGDRIPGDAPALVDLHVSSEDDVQPAWALFGWTPRPRVHKFFYGATPFGLIQAEDYDSGLEGWSEVSDTDYRGGDGLRVTTSGAGTAEAHYEIDPTTLAADPWAIEEVDVEVWARIELASTVVSPRMRVAVRPGTEGSVSQPRYDGVWGSQGKLLVKPSSGTRFRYVRLGAVTLASDPDQPGTWILAITAAWAAGSSGSFGLDELLLVPATSRAAGPTGRPLDSQYPRFIMDDANGLPVTKTIRADLSGAIAHSGNPPTPDSGLGQSLLELPAGEINTVLKLSSLVPDDPTVDTTSEQEDYAGVAHRMSVWPRTRFVRGA